MSERKTGFDYALSIKRIREYTAMPVEKRLAWLYQLNILRKNDPKEIIDLQDKFRRGEI